MTIKPLDARDPKFTTEHDMSYLKGTNYSVATSQIGSDFKEGIPAVLWNTWVNVAREMWPNNWKIAFMGMVVGFHVLKNMGEK